VCAVAIHVLVNAEYEKQGTFRVLTFMTICSLVTDILWLAMRPGSDGDPEYTSGEGGVAKFS
jgi:hypothetical protein